MFTKSTISGLEALVLSQRAEISDLRAAMRAERESFASERARLLDQLIALTQPAAHRELHPKQITIRDLQKDQERRQRPQRLHFPGTGRQSFPAPPPGASVLEAEAIEAAEEQAVEQSS